MSRLTPYPPLSSTTELTAAELDNRFDTFETASTALDANNVRDGGVDLPQYAPQQIIKSAKTVTLGPNNYDTVTNITTVTADTVAPAAKVVISDPTATNASMITYGAGGLTLSLNDFYRVSWHLNVRTVTTGTPYLTAGAWGLITLVDSGGGTIDVSAGYHAWPFYLEWDITSSALANWVPVTGQTEFVTLGALVGAPAYYGSIDDVPAASFASSWFSEAVGTASQEVASFSAYDLDWRTISGSWTLNPSLTTIYGLRLVMRKGVYCAITVDSGASAMAHDTVASNGSTLYFQSGQLTAIAMRIG